MFIIVIIIMSIIWSRYIFQDLVIFSCNRQFYEFGSAIKKGYVYIVNYNTVDKSIARYAYLSGISLYFCRYFILKKYVQNTVRLFPNQCETTIMCRKACTFRMSRYETYSYIFYAVWTWHLWCNFNRSNRIIGNYELGKIVKRTYEKTIFYFY